MFKYFGYSATKQLILTYEFAFKSFTYLLLEQTVCFDDPILPREHKIMLMTCRKKGVS